MQWKTGKLFKQKEDMEETTNVHPFQVIEGGLSEPLLKTNFNEPPVDDWLTPMTPGTVFLVTKKMGFEPVCSKLAVKGHAEGEEKESAVELSAEGQPDFWVIAHRFCSQMKLVAVLARGFE